MSSSNIEIRSKHISEQEEFLTPSALSFLAGLHQNFNHRREVLLRYRSIRQKRLESGILPDFTDNAKPVRHLPWSVAFIPDDLKERKTEITGSIERKTIVQALNSGANVFVADLEDATSPTWENCIRGQYNLREAVKGDLLYMKKEGGLNRVQENGTAIEVRPRGLHRVEKHLLIGGEPISASLFDFGLYLYHNVLNLKQKGSGPYFSLPKLVNRREARWWNDVFKYSENKLHLSQQTIKTTACIETLPAVFEIDEIIYELRDYLTGLQAGRWNYLFSLIKNFRRYERYILPDLDAVDINLPFMEAYNRLLVKFAHRRNVHTIGGITAILPDKREDSYEKVMKKAREDCLLEAQQGFDGTQVAHPDLIPVAQSEFEKVIGKKPHQKDKQKEDRIISRLDLLYTHLLDSGKITEGVFRHNLDVLILYIASWLNGRGVIELDKRLENGATAEIYRTQMWQWSHQAGVMLADGRAITEELWEKLLNEEKERITQHFGNRGIDSESVNKASELISDLVWKEDFESYMTEPAYNLLE